MQTLRGRVVYNRRHHPFGLVDLLRILSRVLSEALAQEVLAIGEKVVGRFIAEFAARQVEFAVSRVELVLSVASWLLRLVERVLGTSNIKVSFQAPDTTPTEIIV